jgi:hypothetical protein
VLPLRTNQRLQPTPQNADWYSQCSKQIWTRTDRTVPPWRTVDSATNKIVEFDEDDVRGTGKTECQAEKWQTWLFQTQKGTL